jgi:probable F420-dependent oxidoreductase
MNFGVNLPNYSSLGNREAMIAIAERAEAFGYSSLWTNDHILVPKNLPEPFGNLLESFTTLSYLAARTERIRLGTGILVLPQRNPLLVAKQAATIQHLSGGRLVLGVAVGWMEQEYEYLRTDFGSRGRLADEYIRALRELFESESPDFHGEHVSYADAIFSPRPRVPIPIVVGGNSAGALKRAAQLGDGWYGLRLSPESARAAILTMDELGAKRIFRCRFACRPGSAGPLMRHSPGPHFTVTRARSSNRPSGTTPPASSTWSSSPSRATFRTSSNNSSGSPEK